MTLLAMALRNLARNRRRTAIAVSALAVAVAALVASRGFINAQHRAMLDGAVYGQLGALQIFKRGASANVSRSPLTFDFEDSAALRARIAAVDGVTGVAPRIEFGAMLANADTAPPSAASAAYLSVTGIDPIAEASVTPRRLDAVGAGRMLSGERELVLGSDVARGLGADPSQALTEAQWPALLANDRDGAPNGEAVRVAGTLLSVMPGDRKVALVSLGTAQRLLRMEGRVTAYAVGVDDLSQVGAVKARLQSALGDDFEVRSWEELLPLLKELHGYQDTLFNLLSAVFLLVVLLGIVNAMLMSVLERVREIGTMMAVGVKRAQVARLFVLEGAAIGLCGSGLGALLGALAVVALHAARLSVPLAGSNAPSLLQPYVTAPYLAFVVVAGAASAALAALWPATRASRLVPVEALRHT